MKKNYPQFLKSKKLFFRTFKFKASNKLPPLSIKFKAEEGVAQQMDSSH